MEKKTLHKNGNSAVTNVTMERKYKKKRKRKKVVTTQGTVICIWSPHRTGLTLLKGGGVQHFFWTRSIMMNCYWIERKRKYDLSATKNIILVQPVLNGLKANYIPGNENENPIILASLIGQEAVFSLWLCWMRIVTG